MNKLRFYQIVIVILMLLNLGTLTFLWLGRPGHERLPVQGRSGEFLIRELNLTSAQQDDFGKLRDEHQERLMQIREKDRILHDRFFNALFQSPADTQIVNRLADSIAGTRKQMEMLTYNHFSQLRQLLTEPQKVKFHKVFRQALERAMPPPDTEGPSPLHRRH
ncbi:MAG: Spy/CpxP family protein refolding chaperone [Bacteroidales bacterium]